MRIYTKLLALLIVALTFSIAAATASANRLSVSEEDFEVIWPEANDLNFTAGGNTVECSVTLLGSFHRRTIQKIIRSLIGTVAHAVVGDCDNGTAVIDGRPPWHLTYEGFRGTLPNITGVRLLLRNYRFTINHTASGAICLTNAGRNAAGTAIVGASGLITGLTAERVPPTDMDDVGASFLCDLAGSGAFEGTGIVTDLDGSLITIRLI